MLSRAKLSELSAERGGNAPVTFADLTNMADTADAEAKAKADAAAPKPASDTAPAAPSA